MKEAKNELMQFVAGIVMLAVGLYILSQKVIVFSGYGGFFSFGGGRFSSGLIIVPLIIGIIWMFTTGANFASKVLFASSASDDKKKKSSRKGKGDDIDSSFSSVKNIDDELEQMKKNIK